MQAIVDGLVVNYQRSGNGKTILLLHGWGSSSADLAGLHKELSKSFDVITPDLPGFGGSSEPKSDWDLSDYSNFLISFLSKIDVKKVYVLAGHSNGGAIAIKLLSTNKLSPSKLVLIASSGIRRPNGSKLKARSLKAKLGKAITLPLPKQAKEKLRSKYYSKIGSDYLFKPTMTGTFKKIVAEDILEDATKISIPTLLIYGEEDPSTPVQYGMMFHEAISGSTLEIIPGSGHFLVTDELQKVLKLIKEYIC